MVATSRAWYNGSYTMAAKPIKNLELHPGGVLGYKRDGGVRRIFLGLKFSTAVFFCVEDLTMYFFGSEKSARIFLGSNFRQANSSYAIQVKVPARSESMIRIICT